MNNKYLEKVAIKIDEIRKLHAAKPSKTTANYIAHNDEKVGKQLKEAGGERMRQKFINKGGWFDWRKFDYPHPSSKRGGGS